MNKYSLTHLSDQVLLSNLTSLVSQSHAQLAVLLAHIAEVDERRLYRPAACPSMHAYCVEVLRLSGDEARSRIRAARAARDYPQVLPALAEGRISLSGLLLLAPHITWQNADELLQAATHMTKPQIQLLVAERFPKPPVPTKVEPLSVDAQCSDGSRDSQLGLSLASELQGVTGSQRVPERVDLPITWPRVEPLSPEYYALQCTIRRTTHEKLLYVRALLGHKLPSGDIPEIIDQALDSLMHDLEKAKFAATDSPRKRRGPSRIGTRHVPAEVKRAVWQRDGGQCTYERSNGERCQARTRLEFDHVVAFARGGEATVEGMRLLCRAHNQYLAECTFGAEFMRRKREQARQEAERDGNGAGATRVESLRASMVSMDPEGQALWGP
jgi:hypothetical protein